MLIDTHSHLSDRRFDNDRSEVLARCRAEGVAFIIEIGAAFGFEGNETARGIAENNEAVAFTVGLHPHDASRMNDDQWARLEHLAATHPKVVGVGETGLDFYYNHSTPEEQKAALARHVELARKNGLPLIIHDRDAHEQVFDVLEAENAFDGPGVFHCFSGDWAFAKRVLDRGWMLALGGVVTFPKALETHEVARKAPLRHLLLETDCPYLTPVPHRGKRNEPWMTRFVAERIASLREIPVKEVLLATGENALRSFDLERLI